MNKEHFADAWAWWTVFHPCFFCISGVKGDISPEVAYSTVDSNSMNREYAYGTCRWLKKKSFESFSLGLGLGLGLGLDTSFLKLLDIR